MKLFISYAHADRDRVKGIVEWLKREDYAPWFDEHLIAGRNWEDQLGEKVKECDVFVYMLSKASVKSGWCQWECATAIHYDKPIIPVLLEPCTIPQIIHKIQYADFTAGETLKAGSDLRDGLQAVTEYLTTQRGPINYGIAPQQFIAPENRPPVPLPPAHETPAQALPVPRYSRWLWALAALVVIVLAVSLLTGQPCIPGLCSPPPPCTAPLFGSSEAVFPPDLLAESCPGSSLREWLNNGEDANNSGNLSLALRCYATVVERGQQQAADQAAALQDNSSLLCNQTLETPPETIAPVDYMAANAHLAYVAQALERTGGINLRLERYPQACTALNLIAENYTCSWIQWEPDDPFVAIVPDSNRLLQSSLEALSQD